jgi:hypothetical protein
MKSFIVVLFLSFIYLYNNLYAAGIGTPLDKQKEAANHNFKIQNLDKNTSLQHCPCVTLNIYVDTSDDNWYGSGDKKGEKTIKTVPKGKRIPKMNW